MTTDSDGDRDETWRSDGGETPGLLLEAGGVVRVGKGYGIARGHHVWYDEATLGFNRRPRDGSERYHGLVAGGRVTAVGTVVDGPEGRELDAHTLFGGTRDEYLTSRRKVAASLRIIGWHLRRGRAPARRRRHAALSAPGLVPVPQGLTDFGCRRSVESAQGVSENSLPARAPLAGRWPMHSQGVGEKLCVDLPLKLPPARHRRPPRRGGGPARSVG